MRIFLVIDLFDERDEARNVEQLLRCFNVVICKRKNGLNVVNNHNLEIVTEVI